MFREDIDEESGGKGVAAGNFHVFNDARQKRITSSNGRVKCEHTYKNIIRILLHHRQEPNPLRPPRNQPPPHQRNITEIKRDRSDRGNARNDYFEEIRVGGV